MQPKAPQGYKNYLINRCSYVLEGNASSRLSVPMVKLLNSYGILVILRFVYAQVRLPLSFLKIPPPQSLTGALKDLFLEQEKERYKLRLQHLIERVRSRLSSSRANSLVFGFVLFKLRMLVPLLQEKLVLSVEQEILRVHTRAARALANQAVPLSICTILKDEEIYNALEPEQVTNYWHRRNKVSQSTCVYLRVQATKRCFGTKISK